MRTILGILMSVTMLFVGFIAISHSAQSSEAAAVTNGTNASAAAFNTSQTVFEGVGTAGQSMLVYGGIGAIIVVALGVLVAAGRNSR